jgi:hypothetical protein
MRWTALGGFRNSKLKPTLPSCWTRFLRGTRSLPRIWSLSGQYYNTQQLQLKKIIILVIHLCSFTCRSPFQTMIQRNFFFIFKDLLCGWCIQISSANKAKAPLSFL